MTQKVLYVAFVWNQHQPFYLDAANNELIMPWVRLHATKDYYQMAAILEEYPEIKATFSLSPSLLEQLELYVNRKAIDYYKKKMKKADTLSQAEKRFLLQHYFDIQWDKVIRRFPCYKLLLDRQGGVTEPERVAEALERFTTQDYLDLQVWFNLVWVDPEIRSNDPFLCDLLEKGRNFTEEDKEELIRRHYRIMEKVIPIHKRLQQKKQIELITTAFYHPIIPLLIDNHSALRASPGLPLPRRFQYEEDARTQVEMAVEQFHRLFGREPLGFWPPEQAVSPEMVSLVADQGFSWTISDEQILARSLETEIYRDGYGHVLNPDVLYRPYMACGEGAEIPIVFRDHHLSDRIGFEYQHMSGEHAAGDLIHRLHKIRDNLGKTPGEFLVTLALDGENAWEWYDADKTDFLHHLYRRLSADPYLETVTVAEYMEKNPPRRRIDRLATGSWVDRSLTRWIGTQNKNIIWDYLLEAREAIAHLELLESKKAAEALQTIYEAEGSDFAWWVDSTAYYLAAPFEALFRRHLLSAYKALEMEPPWYLFEPILNPGPGEAPWETSPLSGPVSIAPGKSAVWKNGE